MRTLNAPSSPGSRRPSTLIAALALASGFVTAAPSRAGVTPFYDLVGTTTPNAQGQSQVVLINPMTGATQLYMTVTNVITSPYSIYQIGSLPDCRLAGVVTRNDSANFPGRLIRIDGAAGTASIVDFGAPLNTMYVEGIDYSPRNGNLLVTFGTLGNFGTNRLALVDANGGIVATSAALAVNDLDTVLSSPTQDLFFDLNFASSPRVRQLTALFPTPATALYAQPPVLAGWYDGTINPNTNEVLFSVNNVLQRLVGNTYVAGATIATPNVRGLTWARLPARPAQPLAALACPGGSASLTATSVGGLPTYTWERLVGGTWVPINNGAQPGGSSVTGANTATITFSNVSYANTAKLRVVAHTECAAVPSAETSLTVVGAKCQPADIAFDDGSILQPCQVRPNSGVNEGDYNAFFNNFFTNQAIGSPADIAYDNGDPLPPFSPAGGVNNGVNEGDYNSFFNNFFTGCPA
ncbi:hypothetical protein BH11PLA1_BH11PLA1_12500 [soil metagenome]